MKNYILLIVAVFMLAACSTPKYAYHFDHYDYNSGKKKQAVAKATDAQTSPLIVNESAMTADAAETPAPVVLTTESQVKETLVKKITSMTKEEKKAFRNELKSEMKKVIKEQKKKDNVEGRAAAKAWDYDLKMAAIFGAVGLVLTALGGVNTVFWVLGAVALVVGVVFLIKWLARQ